MRFSTRNPFAGRSFLAGKKRWWLFGALVVSAGLFAGTRSPQQAGTLGSTQASGQVERLLVDPSGQLDGVLLRDHTWIRISPSPEAASRVSLRPGDQVTVSGVQTLNAPNRVFDRAQVQVSGQTMLDASTGGTDERRNPDSRGSVATSTGARWVEESSPLLAAESDREGRVTGLVLQSGTVVLLPANGRIEAASLKAGQPIAVAGIGKDQGNNGRWIDAMEIRPEGGAPLLTAASAEDGKWGSVEGRIEHVLLTPHGEVDGILLADGKVLRFAPLPPEHLAALLHGTPVRAAGPESFNQLRPQMLVLSRPERVVYLQEPFVQSADPARSYGPPGLAPQTAEQLNRQAPPLTAAQRSAKGLAPMSRQGKVAAVLRDARGSLDGLVLADGTTVQTGRNPGSDLATRLKPGQTVQVTGKGGKYPQGVAILAESVEIAPAG